MDVKGQTCREREMKQAAKGLFLPRRLGPRCCEALPCPLLSLAFYCLSIKTIISVYLSQSHCVKMTVFLHYDTSCPHFSGIKT